MSIPPKNAEVDAKRYVVISAATGALDFLIAFALLHAGLSPAFSLAAAIVIAGGADYLALEWWGRPGREGSFSLRRLVESGLVELGTYFIRLGALWTWRTFLPGDSPLDHLLGLGLAYGVGFALGYFVRSRIVFAAPDGYRRTDATMIFCAKENNMDKDKRTIDCSAKDTDDGENSTGVAPGSTTARSLFDVEGFVSDAGSVQDAFDAASGQHNARRKKEFEQNA